MKCSGHVDTAVIRALTIVVLGGLRPQVQTSRRRTVSSQTKPSLVFCHGILADGSCFNKVMPAFQAEGYEVISAQYPLDSNVLRRPDRGRAADRLGHRRPAVH
jgi:hypothetical protein